MGSARGSRNRTFVVYQDVLQPLRPLGCELEAAFAAIMEKCGYEPIWSSFSTATLEFRNATGPDKGVPVGILAPVMHPRKFTVEVAHGEYFARMNIMHQVLAAGLNGWFANLHVLRGISDDHGVA